VKRGGGEGRIWGSGTTDTKGEEKEGNKSTAKPQEKNTEKENCGVGGGVFSGRPTRGEEKKNQGGGERPANASEDREEGGSEELNREQKVRKQQRTARFIMKKGQTRKKKK